MSAFRRLAQPKMWREAALTVGAVLGTVCIVATIAAIAFGIKPLIFRSGSMAPTISTGALALAKHIPASDIKVGDIVSVKNQSDTRVTHRVRKVDLNGNSAMLTLKGDANDVPDAEPYVVSSADRVFFEIPKAGYVVVWASSPTGIFAGGLLVGLLLFVAFGPGSRRNQTGKRRAGAAVTVMAMGLASFSGTGAMGAKPTVAAFLDTATATSTHSAHMVLPPDSSTCSADLLSGTITWPEKNSMYDYEAVLKRADGTAVSTRQITGAAVSTTYTGLADFGLEGIGTDDLTVEVRSYLAAFTAWRSGSVLVAAKKLRVVLGTTVSCV